MKTRILVVEDNEAIREILRNYLSRSGFEVVTVVDGIEALLKVSDYRPDLILMDMGLPKLNGWQTTQRLRARPESARIPIVALTAYVLDDERNQALHAGCDAFVAKPIDFTLLMSTITDLLGQQF